MTLTFHALWMLCAIGAVVFAASASSSVPALAALSAGFAAAALLTNGSTVPDAVWTGGLVALAAAALLTFDPGESGARATIRPTRPVAAIRTAAFAVGGMLAGLLATLLDVQGMPSIAALSSSGALVVVTIWLAQSRPWFAPHVLKEEGLLATAGLGLAVAIVPGVIDGWYAATTLSDSSARVVEPAAIPVWTLVLLLMSSALGALYSLWSRR